MNGKEEGFPEDWGKPVSFMGISIVVPDGFPEEFAAVMAEAMYKAGVVKYNHETGLLEHNPDSPRGIQALTFNLGDDGVSDARREEISDIIGRKGEIFRNRKKKKGKD